MKGWVGFTRSRNPSIIGRLIQFFTRGPWTHTFIVLGGKDQYGFDLVMEAGKWEVLITRLDKYQKADSVVKYYEPLGCDEGVMKGLARAFGLLEKQYGYFQLLGFVLMWAWKKLTGRPAANPFGGGVICSELSVEYIKATGIDYELFKDLDKNSVDPVHLEQIMARSIGWAEVKV